MVETITPLVRKTLVTTTPFTTTENKTIYKDTSNKTLFFHQNIILLLSETRVNPTQPEYFEIKLNLLITEEFLFFNWVNL